jgi:hypothetical protein
MYNKGIDKGFEDGMRNEIISRKIYLSFPTEVFKNKQEDEYEIRNAISIFFNIPIYSVHVAGSSKTGYSYYQNQPFEPGISDLDIAVVDPELYRRYTEIVFKKTNGLKNLSEFGRTKNGVAHSEIYQSSILKGIFRPDAMPTSTERKEWFKFFNKLSEKYVDLFKDINCGIYFSQTFFEFKQADNIDIYKELKQYGKI